MVYIYLCTGRGIKYGRMKDTFAYSEEKFADIQMLRYKLPGFEELPLQKKIFIYYLSQATLCGRDITTDQFGKYNLRIRKTLEALYLYFDSASDKVEFEKLIVYLKRVWFSNGIYHHYGCEKLIPEFSETFFRRALRSVPAQYLPMEGYSSVDELCDELCPVIFNPDLYAKRVNKSDGEDLVQTSACNYYDGVTQQEVEAFYNVRKQQSGSESPSWGLNSKLVKRNGQLEEIVWKADGMYGPAIEKIIYWLEKAKEVSENLQQKKVLDLLIAYYRTGDLELFDRYSIEWLNEHEGTVDFVNGFIEVYGDPLGLKASWEGIVEYKDWEATRRTQTISSNAQWFENHSPVDSRFKKENVRGVTANVVCAAMLGGDEYPSTAIGINLPNADWIRAKYGSKSVTIGNLTDAYNKAARNNGFKEEFVVDKTTLALIEKYGDLCDDLHTDLHECLGHGSGKLLPGVNPDALKAYGNTIEEARADLFGLYYLADPKLVELGLTPDTEAYKSQYYSYMMNGLMTQLTRIELGKNIEEAHMRNRALIAHWGLERGGDAVKMVQRNGKTYVEISDYACLRDLFAQLLAEIQRIKSEGDFSAARKLVEQYAVKVDAALHNEVLERYRHLNLAPYKGFINPVLHPVTDETGVITDVAVDYTESYEAQMLRYSKEYGFLI
ncbi:MAG: dihydrofolate reductase [Prevotella sp.]|nr:MAG: dihydrofolate reductase [Prevotella sp.]